MSATMRTLQLSKHGAPLLVFTVERNEVTEYWIEAFVVRPHPLALKAEAVEKLGVQLRSSDAPDDRDEALSLMRDSIKESVLLFAAKELADVSQPVDAIEVGEVDAGRMRAWRSLGLYPALDADKLPRRAEILVAELAHPFKFLR